MVKKDFFLWKKKKEWKPYFGFSIYSTIGTQVFREVRNNYKKYKSLKFVLFEIERQPMLLSKPIVPFFDIHTNEQVITRFDIIICCRYLLKNAISDIKGLSQFSTKEGLGCDEWTFSLQKITSSFEYQTSWLKRHLSRNVLRQTVNWFFLHLIFVPWQHKSIFEHATVAVEG